MAARLELLKEQFFGNDGDPLSGGKLYTYIVGTTTEKATYTTADADVEQANPVVLDSSGRIPSDLYGDGYYKIVIKDSDDVTIDTIPSVCGINTTSLTTIGDYSGDFDAAITAIGATETTLYIDSTATMSEAVTVPATCKIVVLKGGTINQSTYTLTLNGPIEAGPYQVFTGTGTVNINVGEDIWADWFGSTKNATTVASMMTMLGSSNKYTIKFSPQTWTIGEDLTITSNLILDVPYGALFSISSGKTLTIQSPFDAVMYQIFTGSGTAVFSLVDCLRPEMWGAARDGTTNDYAALVACFTAASGSDTTTPGRKVVLSSGIYAIESDLDIPEHICIEGPVVSNSYGPAGTSTRHYQGAVIKWTGTNPTNAVITSNIAEGGTGHWGGARGIQIRRLQVDINGENYGVLLKGWNENCLLEDFEAIGCASGGYCLKIGRAYDGVSNYFVSHHAQFRRIKLAPNEGGNGLVLEHTRRCLFENITVDPILDSEASPHVPVAIAFDLQQHVLYNTFIQCYAEDATIGFDVGSNANGNCNYNTFINPSVHNSQMVAGDTTIGTDTGQMAFIIREGTNAQDHITIINLFVDQDNVDSGDTDGFDWPIYDQENDRHVLGKGDGNADFVPFYTTGRRANPNNTLMHLGPDGLLNTGDRILSNESIVTALSSNATSAYRTEVIRLSLVGAENLIEFTGGKNRQVLLVHCTNGNCTFKHEDAGGTYILHMMGGADYTASGDDVLTFYSSESGGTLEWFQIAGPHT